jgi:V/A-type H+-transporting ATPase subunit D
MAPLRLPPGRAGRLWLLGRIATARRARELLDQKRHVLQAAERAAAARRERDEAAWREAWREAERWLARSAVLDGERALRIAAAHVERPAALAVDWRSAMGVRHPARVEVELPPQPDLRLLPGGAALVRACAAHRRALGAAAAAAAARSAHERLAAELRATQRRLRAIEQRWLPRHEQALAELEIRLDEAERAEITRTRWFVEARASRTGSRAP